MPDVAIWPFDNLSNGGPAIVEIYTRIALRAAGVKQRKIRRRADLKAALVALGAELGTVYTHEGPIDDHCTDAIMSAAWLRQVAGRAELWSPSLLTPEIAATEGWTFGVAV